MKFYVLENDGMSLKPFSLSIIKAKNKENAYDKYEETSNIGGFWVISEEEFNQLKELVNSQ